MNWYGKSPLEMECPHCGAYAAHRVVRTEPKAFYWSDETTEMFKRIVGRDISYRRRTKCCSKCQELFQSIEMAKDFLAALTGEVRRLETSLNLARSFLDKVSKERDKLQSERGEINKALTRVSTLLKRTARKYADK